MSSTELREMDLGIQGRKAIVMASSQGLGKACALALAAEGCEVVINGRDAAKLDAAQDEIRAATQSAITAVVADITTDGGRAALLHACPEPDILVTNNAGPPPGSIEDWDHKAWISAWEANMVPHALMIRAVLPSMCAHKFGRIINLTSAMVKAPFPVMGLSTAARSGLTAMSKAVSHVVAADNVTINNLLPERFDTDRTRFMAEHDAKQKGISFDEAKAAIAESISAKRLGRPEEFGAACAFLCSIHAGYISGQNLQLDGGTYEGVI
jgi:3-oxoacyl-[acyl-carrier protein] reductase